MNEFIYYCEKSWIDNIKTSSCSFAFASTLEKAIDLCQQQAHIENLYEDDYLENVKRWFSVFKLPIDKTYDRTEEPIAIIDKYGDLIDDEPQSILDSLIEQNQNITNNTAHAEGIPPYSSKFVQEGFDALDELIKKNQKLTSNINHYCFSDFWGVVRNKNGENFNGLVQYDEYGYFIASKEYLLDGSNIGQFVDVNDVATVFKTKDLTQKEYDEIQDRNKAKQDGTFNQKYGNKNTWKAIV